MQLSSFSIVAFLIDLLTKTYGDLEKNYEVGGKVDRHRDQCWTDLQQGLSRPAPGFQTSIDGI